MTNFNLELKFSKNITSLNLKKKRDKKDTIAINER